jgi:hypothetical protein
MLDMTDHRARSLVVAPINDETFYQAVAAADHLASATEDASLDHNGICYGMM